jgi:hypothetical protein
MSIISGNCPLLAEFNTRCHMVKNTPTCHKRPRPRLLAVANFEERWCACYRSTEESCTVNVNCNVPTFCALLIIYHISVLIYSLSHIFMYLVYIVSTNHMHF